MVRSARNESQVLAKAKGILNDNQNTLVFRITNTIGMPDLIANVNGRFLGIEVKDDKNGAYGLTKAQKIRLRSIAKSGGVGCVIDKHNADDFKVFVAQLSSAPFTDISLWGCTRDEINWV